MPAEAPVAEAEVKVSTPATPTTPPGSITIDLGNLGKKAQPAKEEPKKGTAVVDPPKEEKTLEVTPDKKPNDKEENMANLRKAREAAEAARKEIEAERDRIKAELEELRGKPSELPEDVKTRLSAVEKLEKEREELRRSLRQADLARDPEFQEKYNKQITSRIGTMGEVAITAGVPIEDWKRAAASWNEDQFAEWREAMTPVQKVKFDAAWTSAMDLYQKQQQELVDAEKTYQELEKQRREQQETSQKQYLSNNEQLARSVLAETLKMEGAKDYEDLGPSAEAILLKAARHEMTAPEIFQQIAHNQVLARVTVKQKTQIEELQAQLAERDKKISEQESFIAEHSSATPRGDAAGKTVPTGEKVPIWQQIQVKA